MSEAELEAAQGGEGGDVPQPLGPRRVKTEVLMRERSMMLDGRDWKSTATVTKTVLKRSPHEWQGGSWSRLVSSGVVVSSGIVPAFKNIYFVENFTFMCVCVQSAATRDACRGR